MIGLTAKQSELLDFIEAHAAANNGVSPSYIEMRDHLGLASKSGINRLITALEERGHIRRVANRARALEVIRENPLHSFTDEQLLAELNRRADIRAALLTAALELEAMAA